MKRKSAAILRSAGLLTAARTLLQRRSLILTYHGVLSAAPGHDPFLNHNFIAADVFDRQMQWLREHYEPVPLGLLVDCYRQRKQPPARAVAITFDDGFANNATVAFPILRRHAIPFTVFVTTGMIDAPGAQLWTERVKRSIYMHEGTSARVSLAGHQFVLDLGSSDKRASSARAVALFLKRQSIAVRDAAVATLEGELGRPALDVNDAERYAFLTWDQVRAMADAGVEFGSHTVSHPILSTLDDEDVERELRESRARIELELKRPCRLFAYPNGSAADFTPRDKRALHNAGYSAAFSLCGGLNTISSDLYQIDRINVGRQLDPLLFEAAAVGLLGFANRTRERMATVAGTPSSFATARAR